MLSTHSAMKCSQTMLARHLLQSVSLTDRDIAEKLKTEEEFTLYLNQKVMFSKDMFDSMSFDQMAEGVRGPIDSLPLDHNSKCGLVGQTMKAADVVFKGGCQAKLYPYPDGQNEDTRRFLGKFIQMFYPSKSAGTVLDSLVSFITDREVHDYINSKDHFFTVSPFTCRGNVTETEVTQNLFRYTEKLILFKTNGITLEDVPTKVLKSRIEGLTGSTFDHISDKVTSLIRLGCEAIGEYSDCSEISITGMSYGMQALALGGICISTFYTLSLFDRFIYKITRGKRLPFSGLFSLSPRVLFFAMFNCHKTVSLGDEILLKNLAEVAALTGSTDLYEQQLIKDRVIYEGRVLVKQNDPEIRKNLDAIKMHQRAYREIIKKLGSDSNFIVYDEGEEEFQEEYLAEDDRTLVCSSTVDY